MKKEELKSIADGVNKYKQKKIKDVNKIVEIILNEAKIRAENGNYTMGVDEWCGDYVPLAAEVCKELEKRGYIVFTGAAYSYYITWR